MPDQKGSESSSPKKIKSSWLSISPTSDFSLSNVPFGVCSFPHATPTPLLSPRCCTAIGDSAVDLSVLAEAGLLDGIRGLDSPVYTFSRGSLNDFMSKDKGAWAGVRNRLISLFSSSSSSDGAGPAEPDPALRDNSALRSASIHPLSSAKMHLPATIGDYTDFYSSREHATNVGTMFRGKDNALQPNWLHLPVGYHGRASTVYVSGTPIRRPCGQLQVDKDDPKKGSMFGPSKLLDFELEVAFFVGGKPNPAGTRLSIQQAKDRIFGFVLMNDWSARDIQKWEYVPLGPFGSKNFGTTISPWVITGMALEKYRTATSAGTQSDPKPLEYLRDPAYDSYDVHLEVAIQGPDMKEAGTVCSSNFKNLYWNAPQQLVHHSVTGCVMNPGDLLASGTISGQDESAFGSMLELSWRGSRDVKLGQSGEVRKFIRDGDNVVMRGWCGGGEDGGANRVGFGVCEGKVLPADPHLTAGGASMASEAAAASTADDSAEGGGRYTDFKLHSYYRSSSSWRVRVALESKCIPYVTVPVDLLKSEQTSTPHADINPMLQVPVLECTDNATNATVRITQSLAIVDFLEEAFPSSGGSLLLLPSSDGGGDPTLRAGIREMAELVNSGVQPLQNLSTYRKIDADSNGTMSGKGFARQMIQKGLVALEKLAASRRSAVGAGSRAGGPFVMGTFAPTLADACVVPQLYNARRFDVDVDAMCPTLAEAEKAALVHPWFQRSHPDRQPDAPPANGGVSANGAPPAAKRNGDKGGQQEGTSDAGDEEQEKKKARAE